jgi:WD40 repeat protein
MKHSLALLILLTGTVAAHCQPARVYSDAGNIFIERSGGTTKLTASEMDLDPVLSPNGTFVVYTRQGRSRGPRAYAPDQLCTTQPRPDELRRINSDGSADQLVLKGRGGTPERQLCDFKSKQFSSDGRRLYFLTPGWAASDALHVYDMRAGEEHFLLPANDVLVLNFCRSYYKDHLIVLSHRYFFLGGSYDWGIGSTMPPAKTSSERSAGSRVGTTWSAPLMASGAKASLKRVLRSGERLCRRDVGQFELHPLLTLPAVDGKTTGGVDLPPATVA